MTIIVVLSQILACIFGIFVGVSLFYVVIDGEKFEILINLICFIEFFLFSCCAEWKNLFCFLAAIILLIISIIIFIKTDLFD